MTLFHSPSVQSPKAYDLQNLQSNQIITRINAATTVISPARITGQFPNTQIAIAQTAVEGGLAIVPTNNFYSEGDIRRYGAVSGGANAQPAILAALQVSAGGGLDAFIPTGVWNVTAAIVVPSGSSMRGEGPASQLAVANNIDGLQFSLDAQAQPTRRSFKHFSIIAGAGAIASHSGISCTVQPSAAWSIDFLDIGIQNFNIAINAQGFRGCTFVAIAGFSNDNGISFAGQNTNTEVSLCTFIRGNTIVAGAAYGVRLQQSGGNTTQSTQITSCYFFGYDIGVKNDLSFETQIVACDLSNNLLKAVEITSVISGFWVEDCWLEVINAAQTHGIDVAAITPTNIAKLYLNRNFIRATTAKAGSIGINLGNSNAGAQVNGNHVLGFDKGIILGASVFLTCRDNAIDINTSVYTAASIALQVNSSATDAVIGPNYIVPNALQATTMANASPNLLVTPTLFPVGSPVQFDASVNGFFAGVTYYVVGLGGNFIQVSGTPGGAAINATGAVAVNVQQTPLPLTYTGATPPAGMRFTARGSFLGTLSGYAAALVGPVDWVANGYEVTLSVRAATNFTGVSNATTMALAGVPALLNPITTQNVPAYIQDNSIKALSFGTLTNAGVFTFAKDVTGAAFTAANNKSLFPWPMKYLFT